MAAAAVAWELTSFPVDKDGFIARFFPTLLFVEMYHSLNITATSYQLLAIAAKQFKCAFVCGQYNVPLICTFSLAARTILLWPLLW